jgi:hypothetical protein
VRGKVSGRESHREIELVGLELHFGEIGLEERVRGGGKIREREEEKTENRE